MDENNIADKSVIAITMTKSKPASTGSPTSSGGPKAQAQAAINRGIRDSAARFRRLSMLTPLPPGVPASAAASNLVDESSSESWLKQIIEKGGGNCDRDTVVRTHRAGCNNPERASDKCDPNAFYYVPEYKILQPMVQGCPSFVKSILEELGKQNPPLLRMIKENKAQFLQLIKEEPHEGGESGNQLALPEEELQDQQAELLRFLNDEPVEGGDGGNPEEQSEVEFEANVTAEEYEAIERLWKQWDSREV